MNRFSLPVTFGRANYCRLISEPHCLLIRNSSRPFHALSFNSDVTAVVKHRQRSYNQTVIFPPYCFPNSTHLRYFASDSTDSKEKKGLPVPQDTAVALPKKSLWRRFVDELKHYWHGLKLLGYEVKISSKIVYQILNGEDLTRRERHQLVKTAGDMFRIVPFIVLIIIPFAEFAIPVLLKVFPNMLPSTFEEKSIKEAKLRKQLKAKLEMAKFLQETLKETKESEVTKNKEDVPTIQEFYNFIAQERQKVETPSIDEIVKYSKLFEDEITLDRMSHSQLQAMCRVLDMNTVGTNPILRFQLRMKLRELKADDKMIEKEGIHTLTEHELQIACHSRGMKSYGVPTDRLREQLAEWLDLHLNRKVPASLLLFSRALYLPSDTQPSEQIQAAISQLPKGAAEEAKMLLQEKLGEKVDAKTKLELLKAEMAEIEKEKKDKKEEDEAEQEAKRQGRKAIVAPEPEPEPVHEPVMLDKAPIILDAYASKRAKETSKAPIEVLAEDVDTLESAIQALASERNMNIDAVHLKELRDDMNELMEGLNSQRQEAAAPDAPPALDKQVELTESRVNRYLKTRLDAILNSAEYMAHKLDQGVDKPPYATDYIVHIDELLETVKKLKGVTDEARLKRIITILDENNDGFISVQEASLFFLFKKWEILFVLYFNNRC